MFLVFKSGLKSRQTAGYNGAGTVHLKHIHPIIFETEIIFRSAETKNKKPISKTIKSF